MAPIGIIHLTSAIVSLILGALIFVTAKGTRFHVNAGRIYVLAMLTLNVSALFIYTLTGSANPFHLLIPISLMPLTYGTFAAFFKRPRDRWLENHYRAMCWSYIGLVAAAVAESFVRLPFLRQIRIFGGWTDFALLIGTFTMLVCIVGGYLTAKTEQRILGRFVRIEPAVSGITKQSTGAAKPRDTDFENLSSPPGDL